MGRICAKGRHEARGGIVRNQGLDFGRCGRCGRDLIRSGREWRAVPPGFRVVWRSAAPRPAEAGANQLLLDLPPVGRALAPYAPRRERNGLAVALELALLGLRGLAGALAVRLSRWAEAIRTPRPRRAPTLQLPAA